MKKKHDEPCWAIDSDRCHTLDGPSSREDPLGTALTDELEDVDRDLVIRARHHRHWREIARHRPRHRCTACAKKKRESDEQAKARVHAVIVRPGLPSPRVL